MARRTGTPHVVTTTRQHKDKTYRPHRLRRSYREDGTVKSETLDKLFHLPDTVIDVIRRTLKGEHLVAVDQVLEVISSPAHGHVLAASRAMERLGMAALLDSASSRARQLVLAMIASRIALPSAGPAPIPGWRLTTLAQDFGVADADESELPAAMNWLLERQDAIEQKLAARHLSHDALALYDLSSSDVEETPPPVAEWYDSCDDKPEALRVKYGLLCDYRGCPVAISVQAGADAGRTPFLSEGKRLQERFGIRQLVMVGDHSMIGAATIAALRTTPGIDQITALKNPSMRTLAEHGNLPPRLFDEHNLVELISPDYPGERLVACRNPALAQLRARKRQRLLKATEKGLHDIKQCVEGGTLKEADAIRMRVDDVMTPHKMGRYFDVAITEETFVFARKHGALATDGALDGVSVIRTSLEASRLAGANCVQRYKALTPVARTFRSLRILDRDIYPAHQSTLDCVRATYLLGMLAYYVEWHMRKAWRDLLVADTGRAARPARDPVAPAGRSDEALHQIEKHGLDDGSQGPGFAALLLDLAILRRNTCRTPAAGIDSPTFEIITTPTEKQRRALALIDAIKP